MSSGTSPSYFIEVDVNFYQCPYEENHRVLKHRIRKHAIMCRKKHPWADIILCEYNPHHHIRSSEYADHIQCCRDKFELNLGRGTLKFPVKILSSVEMSMVTTCEDWNVNCYPALEPKMGSTSQKPSLKSPLNTDEIWD